MADTYTVAVRMPVAFESAAEMAGWVERAICNEMAKCNWTGGCYVIWRDDKGKLQGFTSGQGMVKPKKFKF